jgi:protein-disulfide isomerase
MSGKQFLLIPLIIGISAGLFLMFSSQTQNNQQLTAASLIDGVSPIMGESNAQITILEWGDYQCTFCYKFHQNTLDIINEQYIKNGKVKLIYKDFPLNGPDSFLAAEATYCAEDQGKYWQFHNELYKNWEGERTGWITRDSLDRFATTIKLNLDIFDACLDDQKYQERVRTLYEFGKEIGIDATPSFLVFNDEKIIKIVGNQPLQVFLKTFDEF